MTSAKLDTCCSENEIKVKVETLGEDCHASSKKKESHQSECKTDCCHSLISPFTNYTIKSYLNSIECKYISTNKYKTNNFYPQMYRPPIS